MVSLQELITRVSSYQPAADLEPIKRAYAFAETAHQGQFRRSGDPYVVHPLSVASIISELKLDVGSICAGLLHDCVEDTSATVDDISKLFGTEVAFLVEGVTKLGKVPWHTREEAQAENFRKMLLAMARDIRVILIKLCDRVDNMRTMAAMPPEKQERIARETMEIYAPLANRLGIQWIKTELEDLSFQYLQPKEYAELKAKLDTYFAGRQEYIDEVLKVLHQELLDNDIESKVLGRPKHLWSIYQKTVRTGRDVDQLFDIVAFRAIVKSVRDCYGALGVVHTKWTPIPGRFKDFIALPKPNMYQSLHTSVLGPKSERIEIQLRTEEMHRIAEEGIAAHWKYKEGKFEGPSTGGSDEKKFAWLRQLMEWQKTLSDPTEFIETVKVDLFADEVYVFTPKGDVKSLPVAGTPIDLAYLIHTEVGNHCSGARVNGLIVPLRYQLRNGDTVEILTSPNQKPNKDWLKFCKSSSAKAKIRHYMRTEQRERSKALGRELIEREMRKHDLSYNKVEKSGDLVHAATELHVQSVDDLLMNVGYGKLLPADVVEQLLPEDQRRPAGPNDAAPSRAASLARRMPGMRPPGIKVAGEDDVLVRFAKCCSPVAGDPIIGVISRGRGVTVHAKTCATGMEQDEERRIEVQWDSEHKLARPVTVQVVCDDKPGLLALISQTFNEHSINISEANCRTLDEKRAVNTFKVSVVDIEQLQKLIRALQKIQGVSAVQRM